MKRVSIVVEERSPAGTVTVEVEVESVSRSSGKPVAVSRAELIAGILVIQSRELLSMPVERLQLRSLSLLATRMNKVAT